MTPDLQVPVTDDQIADLDRAVDDIVSTLIRDGWHPKFAADYISSKVNLRLYGWIESSRV